MNTQNAVDLFSKGTQFAVVKINFSSDGLGLSDDDIHIFNGPLTGDLTEKVLSILSLPPKIVSRDGFQDNSTKKLIAAFGEKSMTSFQKHVKMVSITKEVGRVSVIPSRADRYGGRVGLSPILHSADLRAQSVREILLAAIDLSETLP